MPDGMKMNMPLAENYENVAPVLASAGVGWLDAVRRDGLARYGALGLPNPRVEAWKYTNLTRMGRTKFVSAVTATQPSLDQIPAGALDIDAVKLVLVNGRLRPEFSDLAQLPDGVTAVSFAEAVAGKSPDLEGMLRSAVSGHDMPMLALNAAYLSDGVVIDVEKGRKIDTPIHLISIGVSDEEPIAFHPRNVLRVGTGAAVTVYESHIGLGGSYLSNGAMDIHIDEDALLRHRKLQNEVENGYHVATASVVLEARARYENYTLHVGGRLVRNEIHAVLNGNGADCNLYGAYAGRGNQHIDTTTFVDHAAPECTSCEVYKGALDDNARGVFQGKILVRKGAQKTDGHQLNKALLLSEGAEIDSKPELEIYADDVKCSHGATSGELDEEQLFYLRARGIDEAEARDLLVAAFLEDSLDVIGDEDRREAFRSIISNWLAGRSQRQEG
ncbi:MAG: Fe-S cluster assembly protein SufD [Alphaproteobacteria bacterium]